MSSEGDLEQKGSDTGPIRLTAWVHGQVQGVGFRWWTRSRALELGLTGYASNQRDGRVLVVAEGSRSDAVELVRLFRSGAAPGRVQMVVEHFGPPQGSFVPGTFLER